VSVALGVTITPLAHAAEEPKPPAQLPKVSVVAEEEAASYKTDEVSSPKYTAPLIDVPQTVVVIPRAVFSEQGATTLTEVLRNTPGITLLAGEGGGASATAGDSFFMRGFDATNSLFIDGVRDQGAYARDVFNLEQVEISKGPSGSYTGRGNAAGSVNLVTKTPFGESAQAGTLTYGSNEHKRVTADFNQPLALSAFEGAAVRLNALWQDGGVAGRDEVQHDVWGIAPSFGVGLTEETHLTLAAQIVRQENIPDYGLPSVALPGLVETDPPVGKVDQSNFYGITAVDFDDVDSDSYTAIIDHDLNGNVALRNLTRYSDNHRLAVITATQNPAAFNPATGQVTRSRQINERINRNFTNQTNLNFGFSTGSVAHTMSSGLEYTGETQVTPARTGAGTAPTADLYNPNPRDPVTGFAPASTGAFTEGETTTVAAYAFDTMELGARWQITAGLRIERYETDFVSEPVPGAAGRFELDTSDTLTSWNIGLVFKPRENGSIYLATATTLTPPGGLNFTLSQTPSNANNPALEPQESTNFELGTKWDLMDGKLAATAALFRVENKNVVTSETIGGTVVAVSFDSEQRVDGIELGLSGQLTEKWQVFAGYSYLDSEFTESVASNQESATLQWTPKNSGNFWTTYQLPLGFSVGAGAQYMDTVPRSSSTVTAGVVAPELPSYWVYNATAAWQATQRVSFRINVNNLTDEVYAASLNNNGGRYNPGAERSYLLSANFSF
jgi:catecholate siderophore receptor